MATDKIVHYYHGDGEEYIYGVPPHDLTEAEWDALAPTQKGDVLRATVARGDDRLPLYTDSKAKPKPVDPEPVAPETVPDVVAPQDGEKG
jgi:hypothetical protein